MAWVSYEQIVEGTSISGKYGESIRIVERWQIRTDSPQTSKLEILNGVTATIGVQYGSPHPDLPALKAMEFSLSPVGRDGMRWILEIPFYIPEAGDEVTESGIPDDVWERSGGATSVPAFTDTAGDTIVNSAGDPLEGLQREREEQSWTLTRCYEDDAELQSDIDAASGRVNSDAWGGGDPLTWKAYFKGAKRVKTARFDGASDGELLEYVEAQWEFRYDELTWKLLPWDVGFMELDGSGARKTILGDDQKPVKQPVGLASDGSALAPGTKPTVINGGAGAEVYDTASFSATFGDPGVLPAGSS